MKVYVWEGRDRRGKVKKGEMEAENEVLVKVKLRRDGLTPVKVREKPEDILEKIPFLKPKPKQEEVVIFTRQFATMIDSGLPIVQCLDILGKQQENPGFKKVILQVKSDVEGGNTLSESLSKFPDVFDELYVNLVSAGEVGGILDKILERLSNYMEKALKLKKQIKGALVYPASIVTVAIGVVIILLVFVIPTFQKMFADFGRELPGPTQVVIHISEFVRHYIVYILLGFFGIVVAIKKYYGTESGRKKIDDLLLKLPVFGPLLRKIAVAKFTRTLGTMVSSGVPILEALEITAKTAGNKTVEKAIMDARASISEGKTISQPLEESGVFPPMVVQMISVGESTGALDTMLNKIADFYDEEVDAAVAALTSLLEPMLMVFLGVVIGGLVIAMYMPIFQMAGAIS